MSPADRTDQRYRVAVPVADLRAGPGGARTRQVLYGAAVVAEGARDGWVAVRAARDGYAGVMHPDALRPEVAPTHKVATLATHLYEGADIRARDVASLSFGARLTIEAEADGFGRTDDGLFVPMVHLAPVGRHFADPAGVAELFLGTPYLWGGNSRLGLDCSGLVQAACLACAIACPGDSEDQARTAGDEVAAEAPLARNDLVFWDGHVAIATARDRLIHANAHHMAVAFEEAEAAVRRIARQGGGQVTARRRLACG